jgi:hypothetical protein
MREQIPRCSTSRAGAGRLHSLRTGRLAKGRNEVPRLAVLVPGRRLAITLAFLPGRSSERRARSVPMQASSHDGQLEDDRKSSHAVEDDRRHLLAEARLDPEAGRDHNPRFILRANDVVVRPRCRSRETELHGGLRRASRDAPWHMKRRLQPPASSGRTCRRTYSRVRRSRRFPRTPRSFPRTPRPRFRSQRGLSVAAVAGDQPERDQCQQREQQGKRSSGDGVSPHRGPPGDRGAAQGPR